MTKWLLLLAVLSANVNAAQNELIGSYAREFSDTPDQADIVVSQNGHNLAVIAFGAYLPATTLAAKDLTALWKRLDWTAAASQSSSCIKFDMQNICYVSAETKTIEGTPVDAGYYYYDPLVGLTKLTKLAH
jgi:hypothetical protein